jgi:hypothetical protein
MVYSKILRDEKTSYQVIGQSLLKNHASIVYYIKSIDWILEHDKLLRRKYRHCINIIKDDGNRALTIELNKYSKQELILWVKKLKNQNNLLSLELERLTID